MQYNICVYVYIKYDPQYKNIIENIYGTCLLLNYGEVMQYLFSVKIIKMRLNV